MAEKSPASTSRHEDSPATTSEGFFGSVDELNMREKELQAEAYKNRLRDEALAGLDEYLAEAPEGTSREEAMAQIVSDLEAYDAKLGAMYEAGDQYATLESSIDQVDSSDRLDGIDRVIEDDPRLRRMNMMARDIAIQRSGVSSPEVSESIQAKEDKLNELLAIYADADVADEGVIDRIIERTVMGAEIERPATTIERNLGEVAATATGVADPREKSPTDSVESPAAAEDSPEDEAPESSTSETTPADPADGPEVDEAAPGAGEAEVAGVDLGAEISKIADLPNLGERMKANLKLRNYLMEKEGKTPEEAAALMDEARNTARDTEVVAESEGAEEEAPEASVDETAPDSPEDLPTDKELADHEEMEKQLREAGALKQPSARSIRRSTRKMRKKKAYQESYDMSFKTEGERMKKEKELYAKYRNDYFTAKGVKNSLLNRLRYRRGRDVK